MNTQSEDVSKNIIRIYFERLSTLAAQIPTEIRGLLLQPYMRYNGFKGKVHVDSTGRIGFEVYREKAGRISIKTMDTKERIEKEIFGILGKENMFVPRGQGSELRGFALTCKGFGERYGNQLPNGSDVLTFDKSGLIGPFEVVGEAEFKVIDISIYWIIGKERWVKHIPFAWVFGNSVDLDRIDPILHAESNFYSTIFGSLYEMIIRGHERNLDKDIKAQLLETYVGLFKRVYQEFRDMLHSTEGDEQKSRQMLIKYKFFLSPGARLIEGQPILNGKESKKPDFRIQTRENRNIYVKMEPPFFKPIEGSKPSRRLSNALKQVSEWKDILSRLDTKAENRYLIITGLAADLDKDEKDAFLALGESQEDLVIVTWDWILGNIDEMKSELTEKLRSSSTA